MAHRSALEALSRRGVFRGSAAVELGMTRKQLGVPVRDGIAERELPDTYRMTALARTNAVRLRAALLWAGDDAAAAGQALLADLDPIHTARSTLEVKTRRLLIAHGAHRLRTRVHA